MKNKTLRKKYSPEQKARIVLEVLKEEQTLTQIASAHRVHPNQIGQWKKRAVEGLALLFTDQKQTVRELQSEHEERLNALYADIGRLTTQLGWLKKKSGLEF
jgi:transposase